MGTEIKIHDAQMSIIRALLFTPEAGFAELQKPTDLDSDHFKFHIAKLVDLGLVDKIAKGRYKLSQKGKEYANRLDTESNTVEKQPKVSVIINGWRTRENSQDTEYLVQQRLKNPYYGYWARIGGKIGWGETILEAAARELVEETGLTATLEVVGLLHKMDYAKETDTMLEDKLFFLVRARDFEGSLIQDFEGGRNEWLTLDEIKKQPKVFQGLTELPGEYTGDNFSFIERKYEYDENDF